MQSTRTIQCHFCGRVIDLDEAHTYKGFLVCRQCTKDYKLETSKESQFFENLFKKGWYRK